MSSSTGQTRKLWVESEDEKLREGVKEQMVNNGAVKDWNRIALTLAGRSNKDCRKRWSKISKDVKKGLWDTQEDARLREGIKQYGMRLDPELSQNNGADQEDKALIAGVSKKGRQWKDIEENDLPGRPKSAINNRHAVVKRRKQSAEPRHSLSSLSQKRTAAALSVSQQDLLEREEELSDSFSESADEDKSDCHRAAASWLSTGDGAFLSSDPLNWDSLECSSQDVHMLGLEDATVSGYISAPGSSSLPSHFLPDEGSLQSQPQSAICMTDMFGHFCNSFPLPMTSSGMMSVNVVKVNIIPRTAKVKTVLELDDIPQKALYQIMSIALENK
ncbi:hypothetical protein DV738_g5039, partial [Chaetothyriales sp. CBS 135597]